MNFIPIREPLTLDRHRCRCLQLANAPPRYCSLEFVAYLALDHEQPNSRGPPLPQPCEPGVCRACTIPLPVSVANGENRDGVANPAESLVPQWLKAFAPRTNVREHSRARRRALRANFPRKATSPAGAAGSLFQRNRPASGESSPLHSSVDRM